ncbi:hypothetical protein O3M35_010994 [Rhynocoris fuscipes]|uniref:Ku domain-containing protein n=1 Tax=Rhynocoris fuscipes TaxID=488301 RepID=A0AAW1D3T7_9HEMI
MEGVIVDDEGDAEVENVWQNQFTGRNCILFLIDARKPMFAHTNATSYFKESMLCCKNAMLDMARKQKNDLFGIMLFGTKISEGKFAPENVSILQELVVPSVSTIKRINSMIENDFVELREKFGDVDAVDITSAINYCQITIHVSKKKLYLKNIILMTYDDDPCGTDEKAAFRARKQANELYQHEIELDVVTIDSNFDSSKFFKELILTSRGELLRDWEGKDPIMKIEDVKNQIEKFTQKYSRRLSFLRIGHKKSFLRLQICLYKLYTEPKKSLTTVKHSDNNDKENGNAAAKENRREVTVTEGGNDGLSQTSAQHGNTALSKQKPECSQLATTADKEGSADDALAEQEEQLDELVPLIAGSFINITKPELKRRMQASNLKLRRGFQLIGFVHTIEVPLYFSIGEPYFVVPYGRDKNSRSAFSHLLQKCIERQVSMFGWFCLTKSATPALTVLHPLEASTEGKGHPKGFQLCKVPFSDEMFEIDEKESIVNAEVSEEQLEAANKIVNKVTIPYRVDVFNDNEYLRRISMIEALAMDYSHCPDQEDSTYVDLEEVQERLGELSIMFNAGDSSTQSSITSGKGMKRAATDGGSQSRGAKQRRPMDIIEMIQRGEANRLTVAELKEVLKAEGVKSLSTMTKTRLVDIATRRFSSDSQQ